MKVCVINNLFPPYARGGAEQVVWKAVEGLLAAGHQVVVVTTAPQRRFVERVGFLAIYRYRPWNLFYYTEAHRHGRAKRLLWHAIDAFHLPSMRYVREVLAAEHPDVVHTHNLMGMSFLIPAMIRRLGIRHIHTVHDVQLVEPSGIIRKKQERVFRYTGLHIRLYSALMRCLMGSPNVVISPSQFLLNFYESRRFFPTSRRVVLRNPTTTNAVNVTHTPHDGVHFLYLGQIEEHKGVLFLVDAFLQFLGLGNRAVLHIAGSGSQLPRLKAIAAGNPALVIHGKVDRAELPGLFAKADVTVVPSLCYENSPTVIFESFAFGVPVLASNVEGIAELIHERENGMTFDTENRASLTEKLSWCVAHSDALHAMRESVQHTAFGMPLPAYVDKLLALYSERFE